MALATLASPSLLPRLAAQTDSLKSLALTHAAVIDVAGGAVRRDPDRRVRPDHALAALTLRRGGCGAIGCVAICSHSARSGPAARVRACAD